MKKFVFLYQGYQEPTPDLMEAWMSWFARVGDKLVDSGNPFGAGREVTKTGARDLAGDGSPITGYSIVSAESIDDAEKLLEGLPIIDSVRIYEAMSM
jgi:hypothetical protein